MASSEDTVVSKLISTFIVSDEGINLQELATQFEEHSSVMSGIVISARLHEQALFDATLEADVSTSLLLQQKNLAPNMVPIPEKSAFCALARQLLGTGEDDGKLKLILAYNIMKWKPLYQVPTTGMPCATSDEFLEELLRSEEESDDIFRLVAQVFQTNVSFITVIDGVFNLKRYVYTNAKKHVSLVRTDVRIAGNLVTRYCSLLPEKSSAKVNTRAPVNMAQSPVRLFQTQDLLLSELQRMQDQSAKQQELIQTERQQKLQKETEEQERQQKLQEEEEKLKRQQKLQEEEEKLKRLQQLQAEESELKRLQQLQAEESELKRLEKLKRLQQLQAEESELKRLQQLQAEESELKRLEQLKRLQQLREEEERKRQKKIQEEMEEAEKSKRLALEETARQLQFQREQLEIERQQVAASAATDHHQAALQRSQSMSAHCPIRPAPITRRNTSASVGTSGRTQLTAGVTFPGLLVRLSEDADTLRSIHSVFDSKRPVVALLETCAASHRFVGKTYSEMSFLESDSVACTLQKIKSFGQGIFHISPSDESDHMYPIEQNTMSKKIASIPKGSRFATVEGIMTANRSNQLPCLTYNASNLKLHHHGIQLRRNISNPGQSQQFLDEWLTAAGIVIGGRQIEAPRIRIGICGSIWPLSFASIMANRAIMNHGPGIIYVTTIPASRVKALSSALQLILRQTARFQQLPSAYDNFCRVICKQELYLSAEFLVANSNDQFLAVKTLLRPNQMYISSAGSLTQLFTRELTLFSDISFSTFDYPDIERLPHTFHQCEIFPDCGRLLTEAMRLFKSSVDSNPEVDEDEEQPEELQDLEQHDLLADEEMVEDTTSVAMAPRLSPQYPLAEVALDNVFEDDPPSLSPPLIIVKTRGSDGSIGSPDRNSTQVTPTNSPAFVSSLSIGVASPPPRPTPSQPRPKAFQRMRSTPNLTNLMGSNIIRPLAGVDENIRVTRSRSGALPTTTSLVTYAPALPARVTRPTATLADLMSSSSSDSGSSTTMSPPRAGGARHTPPAGQLVASTMSSSMQLPTPARPDAPGQSTRKCPKPNCDCDGIFANEQAKFKHINSTNRELVCPQPRCGKRFFHDDTFAKHFVTVHNRGNKFPGFQCPKCISRLAASRSLWIHMDRFHAGHDQVIGAI